MIPVQEKSVPPPKKFKIIFEPPPPSTFKLTHPQPHPTPTPRKNNYGSSRVHEVIIELNFFLSDLFKKSILIHDFTIMCVYLI